MSCLIRMIKYCTDKIVNTVNCILIPASGLLIIGKIYEYPEQVATLSWEYIFIPAGTLTIFNMGYFILCDVVEIRRTKISNQELIKLNRKILKLEKKLKLNELENKINKKNIINERIIELHNI